MTIIFSRFWIDREDREKLLTGFLCNRGVSFVRRGSEGEGEGEEEAAPKLRMKLGGNPNWSEQELHFLVGVAQIQR